MNRITLAYNPDNWGIMADSSGNLAIASGHDRIAQDVASAAKMIKGEALYSADRGVSWPQILGQPLGRLAEQEIRVAGLNIPGCVSCEPETTSFRNREQRGVIRVTDDIGEQSNVPL